MRGHDDVSRMLERPPEIIAIKPGGELGTDQAGVTGGAFSTFHIIGRIGVGPQVVCYFFKLPCCYYYH